MSVFLGNQKVGVSYFNGITPEEKIELNEAVNYRIGKFGTRNIPQMIEELKKKYGPNPQTKIMYSFSAEPWTRPQSWPDLDSLNLTMSGDDFIYMTYDLTAGNCGISLYIEKASNGTDISVEVGSISNGAFVLEETLTGDSGNYQKWYSNASGYKVVKITGSIARCYCTSYTNDDRTQHYRMQPIVERIAYVPNLVQFSGTYSSYCWAPYSLQREKVANGDGSKLTSLYYAWAYAYNLRDLDISGLSVTTKVTTITYAFEGCVCLKQLDLKSWNVSKVTAFHYAFENCRSLISLDLTGWDTSSGTNLSLMFTNCLSLEEIKGINGFNTKKVTNFAGLFNGCRRLKNLDVSGWETDKLTNLGNTFANCYLIEELDLSGWNVDLVTTVGGCFSNCFNLKKLNITGWNLTKLTSIATAFYNCRSLQNLDISGFHIDSKCTNMYSAFYYCTSLRRLDFPEWDVSGVTTGSSVGATGMFSNCWSLETITGISNWQFDTKNTPASSMFDACLSLKNLDVSGWDVSKITTTQYMFRNCYSLESLNLSSWNFSSVCTNMANMFQACYSLKEVGNIGSWDISGVTTLAAMFSGCWSLLQCPNISSWSVENVTTTDSMFSDCHSLKEVNIQNWNLANCTTIASMFRYCYNLKTINISGWTISALTKGPGSFIADCWSLENIVGLTINNGYNISFTNCYMLSVASLNTIIAALPSTSTARTLTLSTINLNKLDSAEKAIATNKGWTLA